jgi:Mrp family chromosome partitioning ATPase
MVIGLNVLGVVENMSGITMPLKDVLSPMSGLRLVDAHGSILNEETVKMCEISTSYIT